MLVVKKPFVVERYNAYMNAVDKSDQILANYNLLRKCIRWWKTLFFHMIDISSVNAFILCQQYRMNNPHVESLKRSNDNSLLDFREELVRIIMDLEVFEDPPVYQSFKPISDFTTNHLPTFSDKKRNCKICYQADKKELKVYSYCSAPQCNKYLHCTKDKNCFAMWHSLDYHRKINK